MREELRAFRRRKKNPSGLREEEYERWVKTKVMGEKGEDSRTTSLGKTFL